MKLTEAIKSIQLGEGIVRCINENGEVYEELNTNGVSIDFVDSRWWFKGGKL